MVGMFGQVTGGFGRGTAFAGGFFRFRPFRLTPWRRGRRLFALRQLRVIRLIRIAFVIRIGPLFDFCWTLLWRWRSTWAPWTVTGCWWRRSRFVRSSVHRRVHHHRWRRRSVAHQTAVATGELLLLLLHHRVEARIHRRVHSHRWRVMDHCGRVDHLRMPHVHHGARIGHGHAGHALVAGRPFHWTINDADAPQKRIVIIPAGHIRSSGCRPHPRSPVQLSHRLCLHTHSITFNKFNSMK